MEPGNGAGPRSVAETPPDDDDVDLQGEPAMSILASASSVAPIDRSIDDEQPQSRPFRGILIALVLSLPIWLLVIWAISRLF